MIMLVPPMGCFAALAISLRRELAGALAELLRVRRELEEAHWVGSPELAVGWRRTLYAAIGRGLGKQPQSRGVAGRLHHRRRRATATR